MNGGEISGAIETIRDITDRKLAETGNRPVTAETCRDHQLPS